MPIRILHLEDNPLDARLINYALEEEGLDCELTVIDNREAFANCLDQEHYDLIFADYTLPRFDAVEALEMVRERELTTPFILVSGTISEESAVKSLRAGATDYVLKDHLNRLSPAVQRALEEHRHRSKQEAYRAEIRRKSHLFQVVEKLALIGTFTIDLPDQHTYWSSGLLTMLEAQQAPHFEPTVAYLLSRVLIQDRPLVESRLRAAQEAPGSYDIAFRIWQLDGGVVYIQGHLEATIEESGHLRLVGVLQDITDRKQAEIALQQSEDRYRILSQELEQRVAERTRELDEANTQLKREIDERTRIQEELSNIHASIDDVIWSFNLVENKLSYVSPSVWRMLGVSKAQHDDIDLLNIPSYILPEDLEHIAVQWPGFLQQGEAQFRMRIRRADGQVRMLLSQGRAVCDEQGTPLRFDGILNDITERARAEEELIASENRYRLISENSSDLIATHDAQGRLQWVSPSSGDLMGYAPAEMMGKSAYDFVHPDEQASVRNAFRQLKRGRPEAQTFSYRLRCADGSWLWVETAARVIYGEGGSISYQTSTRDISERKRAESEIQRALRRERELNELKSSFVSMASHQFRTPLTVIKSNAQMLRTSVGQPQSDRVQGLLRRIETEVNRLTELMDDVLILGRVDTRRLKPSMEPTDVVATVRQLLAEQFSPAQDGRTLCCEVSGTPRHLHIDRKLLEHTLSNLLSNAIKYSPQREAPEIALRFRAHELMISVRDYGIGIPQADWQYLFQSFYRASNAQGIQGTGLGLTIAREFTMLNGGQIAFESEEGQGSVFTIRFPYDPASPRSPSDTSGREY